MSKAIRKKLIQLEILEDNFTPPTDNQQIVRVLSSKDNNLHEVEAPNEDKFLVSMPTKYRKTMWVKRGHFILIEPSDEGGNVKAEIVKILTYGNIKYLKKNNLWPKEFDGKSESGTTKDMFVYTNWTSPNDTEESNSDTSDDEANDSSDEITDFSDEQSYFSHEEQHSIGEECYSSDEGDYWII